MTMSDTREIIENITQSYEDRAKTIDNLSNEVQAARGEARDLIDEFRGLRKAENVRLKKELSGRRRERISKVKELKSGTNATLSDFREARQERGTGMRQRLARDVSRLKSEVSKALGDARETVARCRFDRAGMNKDLRGKLSQSSTAIKSEVGRLSGEARGLIKDFHQSLRETSDNTRKTLEQARSARKSELSETQSTLRKSRAGMSASFNESASLWKELSKDMKVKRSRSNGRTAVIEPQEETVHDFESKLMEAVTSHPEGITLTDIAASLGTVPVVLGRAAKSLIEKGKIRKEDRLYFIVSAN